jgi:hypothetical protein
MSADVWISLNAREKVLLIDALRLSRTAKRARSGQIDDLVSKLAQAKSYPQITIGVQGGLVQWVLGNPFPIRVCDYDIEGQDDLDIDERGQPCRIWFEPADPEIYPPSGRGSSRSKNQSRSLNR